jgi:hypothetical protein
MVFLITHQDRLMALRVPFTGALVRRTTISLLHSHHLTIRLFQAISTSLECTRLSLVREHILLMA